MAEFIQSNISFLIVGFILVGIFVFCGWFIKRHFMDGRWPSPTTRFTGRQVSESFQNVDKKEALEQVAFLEEEDREENHGGEGNGPEGRSCHQSQSLDSPRP